MMSNMMIINNNNYRYVWCLIFLVIFSIQFSYNSAAAASYTTTIKRSASSEENMENFETPSNNRLNVNYDEYPMVVPKRAAILLDRILVALHHALEDGDKQGVRRINDLYSEVRNANRNGKLDKDFQRKMLQINKHNNNMDNKKLLLDDNYDINDDIPESLLIEKELNRNQLTDRSTAMDLQRRGHGNDGSGGTSLMSNNRARIFWRCYFNAVTCF